MGVDLAGNEARPTGIAIIVDRQAYLKVIYTNDELISLTIRLNPTVIAIDAPLTRPMKGEAIRMVDKLMLNLGFRVLPPGFPGMIMLTERGIKLKKNLEEMGVKVIETHPSSAIKALGLKGRDEFLNFMINAGFYISGQINKHTIDALTAAYTALSHLSGKCFYVKAYDGEIALPIISGKSFNYFKQFRHMSQRRPVVAVDIIILNNEKVVLVKRLNEPYKGYWALPGGFVEYGETVEQAAIREAKEETGLNVEILALVGVYSDPKRDPRGHVISIAFLATTVGGELRAATDAKEVKAFSINELPDKLAFDHAIILRDSLELARKLNYLS